MFKYVIIFLIEFNIFHVKSFNISYILNVIYYWDGKATFSAAITSVFSVTYTSEIILIFWFGAWKTFLIIINVEKSCAGQNFLWKLWCIGFRIVWWIESPNGPHLFLNGYILYYKCFYCHLWI